MASVIYIERPTPTAKRHVLMLHNGEVAGRSACGLTVVPGAQGRCRPGEITCARCVATVQYAQAKP